MNKETIFRIARYNVPVFEPASVHRDLKIAWDDTCTYPSGGKMYKGVIGAFEEDAQRLFKFGSRNKETGMLESLALIPSLKALNAIPQDMTLEDFSAKPREATARIIEDLRKAGTVIPSIKESFFVDTTNYKIWGVPKTLDELKVYHDEVLLSTAEVFFVNAVSASDAAKRELIELARTAATDFPKLNKATWILTESLSDSISGELYQLLTAKRGGQPNGCSPAAKRLTITCGLPFKVASGGSRVLAAQQEAYKLIQDRLEFLRMQEGK